MTTFFFVVSLNANTLFITVTDIPTTNVQAKVTSFVTMETDVPRIVLQVDDTSDFHKCERQTIRLQSVTIIVIRLLTTCTTCRLLISDHY